MAVITTDEHGEVEYSKCQAYSPDWEQVKDHLHKNLAMYLLWVLEDNTILYNVYGFFKTISKKSQCFISVVELSVSLNPWQLSQG